MAQRAGVAISTVSKVFSGRGEVQPALRARVVQAAEELGYRPNFIAQSLRRGATDLIGFVASDLSNPFSAEVIAGAEFVLRPAGYALLVMSSNYDPAIDAANVRHLNSRRVDAILVSPSREEDPELIAALSEFDGPIVALESELEIEGSVDAVCADHRGGMHEAIGHLVGLGHSRIAALTGPLTRRSGRERLAGFQTALAAHGLSEAATPLPTEHRETDAEAEVLRVLRGAEAPTAILACSLPLLVGTLRAIDRGDRRIGRDLALIAWDDTPLAELSRPPIAVVDRDPRGLGAAAATIALRRLGRGGKSDYAPGGVEILPTRFIPRASCMALAELKQPRARA